MPQTKSQIQSLLAAAGAEPRHRFGQNFMIDQNLVRLVADAGEIAHGDTVIEVGPGTGTLTEELLARGANVIAVEIDRDLASLLRERFIANPAFTLIEGDALAGKHHLNEELLSKIKQSSRPPKLVANLPYNIASPLVIELLLAGVELLAFVVQKEVADRLRAEEGGDDYGPLTVMARMLADVEYLRKLGPDAFWPAPKVDSALVRLRRHDRLGGRAAAFSHFVQKVFASRRKTLRKALVQGGYDADAILAARKLDGQIRAENLAPETFLDMFRVATSAPPSSTPPQPAPIP